MQGQITTTAQVARFIESGNASFTLVSEKTGTRFTFRARRPEANERYPDSPIWLSVLVGPDNERDYRYIGATRAHDHHFLPIARGPKSQVSADAPSFKALNYFLGHLSRGEIAPHLQFWHEGRCGRCGRKLTDPESIARGLGPECATK